jgi:hypothetical protein
MERFYNMITSFVYRSQMDNLKSADCKIKLLGQMPQINPGPDTSLQSQITGLNTQQVRSLTELSSSFPPMIVQ